MTPKFITLPSGARVNSAHIIHFMQSEHEGQIKIVLTDEPTPWLETMTLEQLDELLSPQQCNNPFGWEARFPRKGDATLFWFQSKERMGVVESVHFQPMADTQIYIRSEGELYKYNPNEDITERVL